jgi:hypothetical protein
MQGVRNEKLEGLEVLPWYQSCKRKRGIFLSQRKYVLDILTKVGMLKCKPVETHVIQNQKLGSNLDQSPTNKERYQRLVGKLIYLLHTRPDIAYVVSMVSHFMHAPVEEHMKAVMCIIRYLKGAPSIGIRF